MKSIKYGTKFFVCVYTHATKDYCSAEFFKRFNDIAVGQLSLAVDNTPHRSYFDKLAELTPYVMHIDVEREPVGSLFQRNVAESVEACRKKFLESEADVMVIIESDVIPPVGLLQELDKTINYLEHSDHPLPWGIIGGLYYPGFHDFSKEGLHQTHHVLSGCTAYKRELLEKHPFRYDPENLGAFPDAIICFDSKDEFSMWNDHSIVCQHLHRGDGGRMLTEL